MKVLMSKNSVERVFDCEVETLDDLVATLESYGYVFIRTI